MNLGARGRIAFGPGGNNEAIGATPLKAASYQPCSPRMKIIRVEVASSLIHKIFH